MSGVLTECQAMFLAKWDKRGSASEVASFERPSRHLLLAVLKTEMRTGAQFTALVLFRSELR